MARTSFKFRLAKLLDVRRTKESLERQKLLVVQEALAVEVRKMNALRQREADLLDRMVPKAGQPLDIDDRWACERYLVQVRKDIEVQGWNVTEAQEKVVAQEAVLRQAGIDVKVLEKLEEKQREEHRLEQLAEQAVFMDDLAGQQYLRQRNHRELVDDEESRAAAALDQGMG
jgi:flagellar FliJ protein